MSRRPFTGRPSGNRDSNPSGAPRIPARLARYAGPAESFGQPSTAAVRHLPVVHNADEEDIPNKCGLALSDFAGCSPDYSPELFAQAPWFDVELVRDVAECRRFAPNDILPGRLPITIIHKHEWRMYGSVDFKFFHIRKKERTKSKRLIQKEIFLYDYLPMVSKYFSIDQDRKIIPANTKVDRVYYRRLDDNLYCSRLADWVLVNDGFSTSNEFRADPSSVHERHLLLQPLLPAEFRYVRRWYAKAAGFARRGKDRNREVRTCDVQLAKDERRWRKVYGYLVSHERKDIKFIEREYLSQMYTTAPPEWGELELCEGFHALMPPILAYQTRHLTQVENSPFWAIFYTEWTASVAAAWLWEIYSECRLWYLPPLLIQLIHQIGGKLSVPLGGRANYEELIKFLGIYKTINWDDPSDIPPFWCIRDEYRNVKDIFKGRRHPKCGDYLLIHPFAKKRLVEDEVLRFQRIRARVPMNHPGGYIVMDEGWSPSPRSEVREIHPVFQTRPTPARHITDAEVSLQTKWEIIKFFLQKIGLTSLEIGHNMDEAVKNVRDLVYLSLKKPGSEQYRGIIHDFFSDFGITEDCRPANKDPKAILNNYISSRVSDALSAVAKKENWEKKSVGSKRNTDDLNDAPPLKKLKESNSGSSRSRGEIKSSITSIAPRRPGISAKVPRVSLARRLVVSTYTRPEEGWKALMKLIEKDSDNLSA